MGKWDALAKQYPRVKTQAEYSDVWSAVSNSLIQISDTALKERIVLLRAEQERLKAELSPVSLELDVIETLFIDRFEERGVKNVKFDDGITLSVGYKPTFEVTNPLALKRWIESNGLEGEFPMKVNTVTLYARCAERMENDEPLPEGVAQEDVRRTLSVKGLKKSG